PPPSPSCSHPALHSFPTRRSSDLRRIRAGAGGQEVKIIAVTASVIDDNRQGALAGGADDFMGKPFREAELFQKLHAHLGVEYVRSEEHTSELQSRGHLVCRLLLEK